MTGTASDKPRILLLSLDVNSLFDRLYQGLLGKLNTVAALEHATNPESALQTLEAQTLQAVLVTDGSIMKHHNIYDKLLRYIRDGGIVVLMGAFSSSVRPNDLDNLFREAGLPWTSAEYLRTTVHLNTTEERLSYVSLPSSYSQKAVFLANVSFDDAWYLPNDDSRIESFVLSPTRVQDQKQTPIAFTNIEKGKLGYVGDTNGEDGSDAVVLAMCGLRDVA